MHQEGQSCNAVIHKFSLLGALQQCCLCEAASTRLQHMTPLVRFLRCACASSVNTVVAAQRVLGEGVGDGGGFSALGGWYLLLPILLAAEVQAVTDAHLLGMLTC